MFKFATSQDLLSILPELSLIISGIFIMLVDMYGREKDRLITPLVISLTGLALAGYFHVQMFNQNLNGFFGMVEKDNYSLMFGGLYLVSAAITVMISYNFLEENNMPLAEYFSLMLFAVVGMLVMTSGKDLLVIFIGLEIMSISSYILVGSQRKVYQASEAALKYLLLGAFSTGFMLYGMSMIFGATGSTNLDKILHLLKQAGAMTNPLVGTGLALILIGVGFKVSMAPFHMWTPDVYQGAPTPISAFLSAASKAAGFAVLVRIFLSGIPLQYEQWQSLLWVLAALTMTLGNLMALMQNNVKRMLAYSSVAHAGYALVAFAAGSPAAISGIIYYSIVYAAMAMGAFGVLSLKYNDREINTFDDLAGLAKQSPWVAAMMTLFMLSMVGMPLTGGFIGKFQIFYAALDAGWYLLTLAAVVNSAISVYYYLRVVVYMYMKESSTANGERNPGIIKLSRLMALTGLACSAILVLLTGIFPDGLITITEFSTRSLF